MSSLNLSLSLKGFNGNNANSCSNLNFSKTVNLSTIDVEEYKTETVEIAAATSLTIFSVSLANAKKIVYIESNKTCGVTINTVVQENIEPIIIGTSVKNGILLKEAKPYC